MDIALLFDNKQIVIFSLVYHLDLCQRTSQTSDSNPFQLCSYTCTHLLYMIVMSMYYVIQCIYHQKLLILMSFTLSQNNVRMTAGNPEQDIHIL